MGFLERGEKRGKEGWTEEEEEEEEEEKEAAAAAATRVRKAGYTTHVK